ncbi:MAG: hypothetical protein GF398_15975 [Chitinivibrionales bacterium]|nr:hypothetical protein [Chitinivibrionales bacterium]
MPEIRLRHHAPLSAPGTRELYLGDEPFLRISLGFTPNWFHQRLGVDFSEAWHLDPQYRYHALLTMKQHVHRQFPMVPGFVPHFSVILQQRLTLSAKWFSSDSAKPALISISFQLQIA